jgi:hypothetical protein
VLQEPRRRRLQQAKWQKTADADAAQSSAQRPTRSQETGTTGLEIGLGKIRITSSVIGLVVLALSLVFCYLFLMNVFNVKPIDLTPIHLNTLPTKG